MLQRSLDKGPRWGRQRGLGAAPKGSEIPTSANSVQLPLGGAHVTVL